MTTRKEELEEDELQNWFYSMTEELIVLETLRSLIHGGSLGPRLPKIAASIHMGSIC